MNIFSLSPLRSFVRFSPCIFKVVISFILLLQASLPAMAKKEPTRAEAFFDKLAHMANTMHPHESTRLIDSIMDTYRPDTLHIKYATALHVQGFITYYVLENFEHAQNLLNRAYAVLQKLDASEPFHPKLKAEVLSTRANIYRVLMDDRGIEYFLRANDIYRELGDYRKIASNYRSISFYFDDTFDFDAILFFQEQSMRNLLADENHTPTDLAFSYIGIAQAHGINDPDKQIHYTQKAYYTLLEDPNVTDANILNIAAGLAQIALRHKEFELAKKYTPVAYRISNEIYGENSVISAHLAFQYVQIYGHFNMMDSVEYYAQKGFEVYRQQGEKYVWKINAYNHMSRIHRKQGNYEKALDYAHKAMFVNAPHIPLPEDVHAFIPLDSTITHYEKLGNALYNKLELYHLMYLRDKEAEMLQRSYAANLLTIDFILHHYFKQMITTDKVSPMFANGVEKTMSHLLWTTYEAQQREQEDIDLRKTYAVFSRLKAGLLQEQTAFTRYPDQEQMYEENINIARLRENISQLNVLKKTGNPAEAILDSINRELEMYYLEIFQAQNRLKFSEHEYEKDSGSLAFLFEEIQQKILPGQAIVDYFYNDSILYGFVVTRENIDLLQTPLDENFHPGIQRYLRDIKTAHPNLNRSARELHAMLLEPLNSHISEKEHLIVIPFKELISIPFEALKDEQGDFLIASHAVSYNFSAGLKGTQSVPPGQIIAYAPSYAGEPLPEVATRNILFTDYSQDELEFIDTKRGVISPLPYALKEIQSIANIFPDNTHLVKSDQATKKHFSTYAVDYPVIHIAGHGYSSSRDAHFSGVFFSTVEAQSLDDSYLFLSDLAKLRFNADLVVLSACQTGTGIIEGFEGAIALPRAFYARGATNVLASQWKVNDKNTKQFMQSFYRFLSQGNSYSIALQKAKLQSVEAGMFPMDWASFVLIGE